MTLPLDNLDDKSFEDLVSDAVARIRVYAPEWTDYNKTDPGITLLELLAWIAEMQIYRLNRVSDKSHLKFLKLLGIIGLRPAKTAVADLIFEIPEDSATSSSMRIPAYTQVAANDPATGEDIIFETDRDLNLVNISIGAVLTVLKDGPLLDNTDANKSGNAYYSAFNSDPSAGDALYLGLDSSPKGQELALAFYLYQDWTVSGDGVAASHSNVNLIWEYYTGGDWKSATSWKALIKKTALEDDAWEAVLDETGDLTASGKAWARIQGDPAHTTIGNHDLFWLRIRVATPGYDIPPVIECILLNVISATQKATFRASFSATGLPGLKIILGNTPVITESLKLSIIGDNFDWTKVEDMDASGPGDRHYILDPVSGTISFGDGIHGKIPSQGGNNIAITFSSGGGIQGNVAAYAINKVLDPALVGKVQVYNTRAATGGDEPGTLEEAIGRARKELRGVYRAVTPTDYELLAMSTPGLSVARAKAIPLYHPSQPGPVPDTVTMIVVPRSSRPMPIPSIDFLKTVYRYLDKRRTIGTELFILGPVYVKISVNATVIRMPMYRKETVKNAILAKLNSFLSPLEGGGPDKNGWPFGRPVYLSEIYALLDQVEGVDYIKKLTLVRSSIYQSSEELAGGGDVSGEPIQCTVYGEEIDGDIEMPAYGLACPGEHVVIVCSEKEYSNNNCKEV